MLSFQEFTLRILLALILGSIIGFQRTRHHKPAGIRTHSLVAMGSCLMSLAGAYGFLDTGTVHDPMRIAAQVVTGVGFIGAGIIYRQGENIIIGVTTAATIWVTAGLGLACATGLYFPAILVTILVMIVFRGYQFMEHYGWIEEPAPEEQVNRCQSKARE